MRFGLTPEQRQFAATVHEVLAAGGGWAELERVGVWGLGAPEEFGGQGAGAVEVVLAAEELGHHAVDSDELAGLGVTGSGKAGSRATGLVAAEPGGSGRAVAELGATGSAVVGSGLAGPGAASSPGTSRFAGDGSGPAGLTAAGPTEGSRPAELATAGPAEGGFPLGGAGAGEAAAPSSEATSAGAAGVAPRASASAAGQASVAVALGCPELASVIGVEVFELEVLVCAAQLLGAARAMVELAVAHAATRRQFGRAVGEFQAVQHRLADVHVALEMARPLVFAAALSLAPRDTSAARVAAADVAQRAVSASLQVHGALGYTQEYSLGRFILLARRLRGRFGSQDFHRGRVLAALEGAWTWE